MNTLTETEVIKAEEELRLAMIASDVNALNGLLAPELIFTNHLGHVLQKQDDIAAHESGMIKVDELTPSEQRVHIHGEVAVVSVLMYLSGSYDGEPGEGNFRFTRVWATTPSGELQVIAGHACVVA